MNRLPQMASVTDFRNNYVQLVERLNDGPIILAQRSKPVAVVISPQQWDNMADELAQLRRIVEGDRQLAEIDAGNYEVFDFSQAPA
jgi:prevent-host-death family protein